MTKDGSNARKRSARDLARAEGISYTEALRLISAREGPTVGAAAAPGAPRVGGVRVTAPGKAVTSSRILLGHTSPVYSVAFHPNGTELASGGDVTARLWDTATGQVTRQISHDEIVTSMALSPDGHTLAAGCENGSVSLWTIDTGEILVLAGSPGRVLSVLFGPDGGTLATSTDDRQQPDSYTARPTLRLWDLATRRLATTSPRDGGYGHGLAFHPAGHILATSGDMAGTALLRDLDSAQITTLAGHAGGINAVAFSPDGRTVATGSVDSTIRLWDVTTGRPTATLSPHGHYVMALAFSPDGHTLATASVDSTIRLWNVGTGETTATLFGHRDYVTSMAFRPDGAILATGSMDATIRLWDCP